MVSYNQCSDAGPYFLPVDLWVKLVLRYLVKDSEPHHKRNSIPKASLHAPCNFLSYRRKRRLVQSLACLIIPNQLHIRGRCVLSRLRIEKISFNHGFL